MELNIKYFGLLAEVTHCSEEEITFSGTTISDLKEQLFIKHKGLEKQNFQVAQNNELINNETKITTNEITLLPPFSGG